MKKLLLYICILVLIFAGCSAPIVESEPTPVSTAVPTPTPAPTPVPTPTPQPIHPAEGIYTIAWISDTQHYSRKFPETFLAMTEFLREQQEALRLGYIIHTGDLVHNYDAPVEWEVAVQAMQSIRDIPHGVLAGNHDVGTSKMNYKYFRKHFGEGYTETFPWYGGGYKNNFGHYDLITLGDTDYLFVYMGYGTNSSCIRWINEVFAAYPDRVGILCLHEYLDTDMELRDIGVSIRKKVVAKNPNLYMVLCGHRYAVDHLVSTFDDDGDGTPERTVYEMISNYQAFGDFGGDGYLRLLQVDEANGKMRILSYSPTLSDYDMFDGLEQRESLVLPLPWA